MEENNLMYSCLPRSVVKILENADKEGIEINKKRKEVLDKLRMIGSIGDYDTSIEAYTEVFSEMVGLSAAIASNLYKAGLAVQIGMQIPKTIPQEDPDYQDFVSAYKNLEKRIQTHIEIYRRHKDLLLRHFPEAADSLQPFFQQIELNLMI